jgi:hypothetical protein
LFDVVAALGEQLLEARIRAVCVATKAIAAAHAKRRIGHQVKPSAVCWRPLGVSAAACLNLARCAK